MGVSKVVALMVVMMFMVVGAFIVGFRLGKLPTVHYVDCFEGDILVHQGYAYSCNATDRMWKPKDAKQNGDCTTSGKNSACNTGDGSTVIINGKDAQ